MLQHLLHTVALEGVPIRDAFFDAAVACIPTTLAERCRSRSDWVESGQQDEDLAQSVNESVSRRANTMPRVVATAGRSFC